MRHRLFAIATLAGCLAAAGLFLGNSRAASTSAPEKKAAAEIGVAQPAVVEGQQCAQCESTCKSWIDQCKQGGQYACYKAAACLCKCNLDAGGCGSSKEALRECYEQNEKSARDLGPSQ
jgi:hypothetical protein